MMKVQTLVTEFCRHVISLSFLSTVEFQNAVLLTEAPSSIISLLFLRLLFFILVRATPQVLAWCAGIASETVASRLPCWL